MPIKKSRMWQLFILSKNKKKYVLPNVPQSTLERNFQKIDAEGKLIARFIKNTDPKDQEGLLNIKELIEIIKKIQSNFEEHDFVAPDFFQSILDIVEKESPSNKCYFRKHTESEEVNFFKKEEAESEAFWAQETPCDYCGKKGKLHGSPWGVPATLSLCDWHLFLLFFDSSIYSLLLLICTGVFAALFSQFPILIPIYILLLLLRFIPLCNIL